MLYIGSLIGDYCGSRFEFHNFNKSETPVFANFFTDGKFTDDTICTAAVMEWLTNGENLTNESFSLILRKWCNNHKDSGYGPIFKRWLMSGGDKPFDSFGNGAAMRVAPCAYYANTLEECLNLAEIQAKTSHSNQNAIDGAKAIAEAIYLARSGAGRDDIGRVISDDFGYSLNKELNEIGSNIHGFDATSQVTVPEAIICFLKSNSFSSCIENAIYIGGDSDTIAAMSGGIAEAYYGIPHCIMEDFKNKLPEDIKKTVIKFNNTVLNR